MKKHYRVESGELLLHFLFEKTQISKQKLKKALLYGAVQVKKYNNKKFKRVRRSTFEVEKGDSIQFFYDEKLLDLKTLENCKCLFENKEMGIWLKPAGAMSQGNQFGDHTSLLRFVEK